ncbi:hypothetical protein CUB90_03810 [Clostridium sp. CT7]|nr:hypothetical protein CUB90_03810 [Clostridium sp. CT7]
MYRVRPSKILNIKNDYTAFCFDEACNYIFSELSAENPKTPKWNDGIENNNIDNKSTIEWMTKHNKAY